MQVTQTEAGRIYRFQIASHQSPFQVDVADSVIPNISNSHDCVAALVVWVSRLSKIPIQQLKLASRTGSSVIFVEVYSRVDEPIDKMLFVLIIDKGQWDYCSPAQIPFRNVRQVATTLITALSPHLLEKQEYEKSVATSIQPTLG